jgi:TolB protein
VTHWNISRTRERGALACLATIGVLGLIVWFSRLAQRSDPPLHRSPLATNPLSSSAIRSNPVANALGAIFPRISPDGQALVVSYQGAIWRVPRSGGTMTRLTYETGFDIEPVWSPDGLRIAYVNSPLFGEGDLRVIEAETGQPVALPRRIEVIGTNVYQKLEFLDDTHLMGVFKIPGQPYGLSWIQLQTSQSKRICDMPRWGRFAVSHDRKSIAYTSTLDVSGRQNGNDGRQNKIFQIPVEGGTPKLITQFASRIYDLCWAADDATLYLVSDFGTAHNDLWHLPLSNPESGMQRMTSGQADEDRPSTSEDGRWLLYTDNRRSATTLVVRDLKTGIDQEVLIDRLDFRQPVGSIALAIRDHQTQNAITARVSIQKLDGKLSAPPAALYRVLGDVPHYYQTADSTWELPDGKYVLKVYRGPEYVMHREQFEVQAGKTTQISVQLQRWANAAAKGWYTGENHIHANYGYGHWYNTPRTMLDQSAGEDLHVSNFMVANSDTDAVFDREFFRGKLDPISTPETLLYWNQEFRSTIWGHMTLLNLKQVVEPIFTGFKSTTNPWDVPTNAQIADRAHWQKAIVNYTHVAQNANDPYENPYTGKGIPIDVALGKVDSLDLNSSYAGTIPLWYRLLNCGFHLPASAGTDTFLNRIPSRLPGGDRVYVKLTGPLTYESWIDGLRAGRSFVSNGPLLEFAAENAGPGDTLELATEREVRIVATATSQFAMDKVEVVYNGQVVLTGTLSDDKKSATIDQTVLLNRSGWLSFRATGPGHADHPVGSLDAHTSPIYVTVAAQSTTSKEDAEYFLKWIDRLSLAIRNRERIPDAASRQLIESQFDAARTVYQNLREN